METKILRLEWEQPVFLAFMGHLYKWSTAFCASFLHVCNETIANPHDRFHVLLKWHVKWLVEIVGLRGERNWPPWSKAWWVRVSSLMLHSREAGDTLTLSLWSLSWARVYDHPNLSFLTICYYLVSPNKSVWIVSL